ncbi:MAG: tRNA threonylcarbamoyladenosine biosynthesis protein RimN [Gammaproteobacteria bacterium]|jgi:L-threonylcarbamoyladenylate synthase|nr:tRNA threonylcarbamoyladenosine biosynthesis protein RimN [Gammaproteobacteria bacterium]MBT4607252.1 tRNA threonylcarbamoyladenosine biosynthesis protein RimN [Thiotrichales bacterium]MBT3473192.1 tRNA threonylcarbamoyladenosine biosynthesis protein RimN [Gammaproteobacteria bacterium]MBT3967770.1 tRNA threonylcarbamoyladenosine biosynthesis protein RimN [Gammaproteobacteria bacterium]MBT4079213.1 tRNA threonylcarbamoyladenosine biosynthesis protein RimN [Gammaproteobacteria bacterium]
MLHKQYTPQYTHWQLRRFSRLFAAGGVFAYPTESVYGLGCDPANEEAVLRLLRLKQRDPAKGLILIASDGEQLEPWIALRHSQDLKKISQQQSRPTTWLVPASKQAPWWITGEHKRIAVRITHFAPVVQLCETVDGALVSTSANRAGHPAQRSGVMVKKAFGNQLDTILWGGTGGVAQPSEIRDLYSGEVVRSG